MTQKKKVLTDTLKAIINKLQFTIYLYMVWLKFKLPIYRLKFDTLPT